MIYITDAINRVNWFNEVVDTIANETDTDKAIVERVVKDWELYRKAKDEYDSRSLTVTVPDQMSLTHIIAECDHVLDVNSNSTAGMRCTKCGQWILPSSVYFRYTFTGKASSILSSDELAWVDD